MKKITFSLLFLTSFVFSQNVVNNATFTSDTSGWGISAFGDLEMTPPTISFVETGQDAGSGSVNVSIPVVSTEGADRGSFVQNGITMTPETEYTLSFYVKSNIAAATDAIPILQLFSLQNFTGGTDNNAPFGFVFEQQNIEFTSDDTWQFFEYNFTTPAVDAMTGVPRYDGEIRLQFGLGTSRVGDFQFDNVVLATTESLLTNEFKRGDISMYVNNKQLTINGEVSGKEMRVMDLSGRTLLTSPVKSSQNQVDLSGLNHGVYLLMTEAGGTTFAF